MNFLRKLKPPIAVVCNDAGGANLIKGLIDIKLVYSLAGPALKIIAEKKNHSLEDCLNKANSLISGTSGENIRLEYDARNIAKKKGILSIAMLDHWSNYEERFIRNKQKVLPDEIWTSDKYAYNIAKKHFKKTKLLNIRNYYLENMLEQISVNTRNYNNFKSPNILYLLEPIIEDWGSYKINGEFQALEHFLTNIEALNITKPNIILKPHPKEPQDKYDYLCSKYKKIFQVEVDKASTLSTLMNWSDIVVGCHTAAMTIALHAKKKVICSLPMYAPKCKLPHKGIIHLKDLIK